MLARLLTLCLSLAPSSGLPSVCVLPAECGENVSLLRLLRAAGSDREPARVSELTAGFCNWVYLAEFPADAPLQGADISRS